MNDTYQYLKVEIIDSYAQITLNRGRSNPLSLEMVNEITKAFDTIDRDPAVNGVLLTGQEGFFSVGLDVIELYNNNEAEMAIFWPAFMNMVHSLTKFSKPFVVAITGHSPAGGCVISICADYRVMLDGKYRIGLNEVQVAIIAPRPIFKLYSLWLGERLAGQYLLEAKMLTAPEAHAVGLVDELGASTEEVIEKARKKLQTYLSFEQGAWKQTKKGIREEVIALTDFDPSKGFEQILTQWWSPDSRKVMGGLVASLQKRR